MPCPVRLRLGALDVGGNYSAQRAQTERSPLTACFQNCTHRRAHVSHQPRGQGGPPPGAGARGQGEPLPCYAAATTRSRSARPHEVGSAGRRHQGMRGVAPRAKGQGPRARGQGPVGREASPSWHPWPRAHVAWPSIYIHRHRRGGTGTRHKGYGYGTVLVYGWLRVRVRG